MPHGQDIKRLIYLHIHRTGGTTLRLEVLYNCLDRRKVFFFDGDESPTRCGSVEELLAMPRAEQEKLEVIVGHMPFGLREHLSWPESWRYVTFMREPVARTVSTYYQVRSSATYHDTGDPLRRSAFDDANRYTLEEYVRNRRLLSWNGMCAFLSNKTFGKHFESDEAMFLEAWRNARELSFVGFVEDYDESVRRLCRIFNWKVPTYTPRHVLTPKDRTLGESELEILRAANGYDQVLYDHFRERFALEGRLEPFAQRPSALMGRMAQTLRRS
jgi:hypothetical protein